MSATWSSCGGGAAVLWLMVGQLAAPGAAAEVSYQGQLSAGGLPADGSYDLRFQLYDAGAAGNAIGSAVCRDQVDVMNGLFDVMLDFGLSPFDGQALWVEVAVRADGSPGNCGAGVYTALSPRQPLASSPYAISTKTLQVPFELIGDLGVGPIGRIVNTNIGATVLQVESTDPAAVASYTFRSHAAGLGGRAVLGLATDTQGGGSANYGVWGQAAGPAGRGVYGYSTHPSGANYGVRGRTESAGGWAGYFEGRGYFSGRLGVGTSAPAYPLHVQGADQFMQRITSSNTNGAWLDLQNTSVGGNVWSILSTGSANGEGAGDLVIRTPAVLAFDIDTSGFVGFGDTTPTFRVELPNTADNGGRGRANAWTTYSSRRWKTNVHTLDNALNTVMKLRGVRFDWNPEHGGAPDIGFVAEEVGAVVPEIVAWEANGEDAQSLAYDRITALAVEAIKAQQQQIESQAADLARLQAEVSALRAAFTAIPAAGDAGHGSR